MITTLCYWFILLWNVPVEKDRFAAMATGEFGFELIALLCFLPLIISVWRSK